MRKNFWSRLIALSLLASLAAGLTACNTVKGAGKDMERGGEKVQDAVDNH